MNHCFAIYPDGQELPTALFEDLEDATTWALEKYGSDRFTIRSYRFVEAPPEITAKAS